jgi:C4-dicarboxylate-specific signal transduction histidine kinase
MNASRIGRVVQMVEAEPAGFAGLSPEKGAQLLAYLVAYCKANETKRASLMEEVQSLLIDGEQIERVIKAQEELSHASTVVERVDIIEEIETTLMLCHDRIAADQIAVVRELGEMAPIEIDRQRLARILVCLIENAGHALEKVAQGERRLTIRAREHGTGVAIEVEDNGVGIPEENLVRVFGFGFSTWPGRRGYGLHASANAAREMGGNLTCRSAGVGRGSTFFLELPLVPRSGSYRLPIAA